MVLASVAISVQIMTPPEEGPRVLGDRITVSHILNPDYRPRHFNGSWISGKLRLYIFNFPMIPNIYHIHLRNQKPTILFTFQIADNELVFLDSEGGLSILEVDSLNQSQIVNNIVFVSTKCYPSIYHSVSTKA